MGVGAAIAIGNHAENGNWALFEQAAIINIIIIRRGNSLFIDNDQFLLIINNLIDKRIKISPTRFLRSVIDPDAAVL